MKNILTKYAALRRLVNIDYIFAALVVAAVDILIIEQL